MTYYGDNLLTTVAEAGGWHPYSCYWFDLLTLKMPDGNPAVRKEDFENSILFFEDIPEFCDEDYLADFFDLLGKKGYLQILNGVIIGKMKKVCTPWPTGSWD